MSSNPAGPTDIVDELNHGALLDLALEPGGARPNKSFAVPSTEELQAAFSDLEIEELIGSGGMGYVFRARQTKLDRTVALKVLPLELSQQQPFADRFAREARAMARLSHPGIVAVYDFGRSGDYQYLVMEYMDGMNLRELLDAGRPDPAEGLRIFEQVCLALSYAHAEGVIHRDIKPENILFSRAGHIALADFGLARLALDSQFEVSITQTRQAMGTLNYMAPEQWENPRKVDHRADVYALGIMLYEVLTGQVPRGSFPPASTLCDVPAGVDNVIAKALQPNAEDRFQSVTEMIEALVEQDLPAEAEYRFSAHGTATNMVHLGAAVLRSLPLPRVSDDSSGKQETEADGGAPGEKKTPRPFTNFQVTLFGTFLAFLIMMMNWGTSPSGFMSETRYFMNLNSIPNEVMFMELLVFCCVRAGINRLGRLRADFLSIILLFLCIGQIFCYCVAFPPEPPEELTIAPLLFFFVVSFIGTMFVFETIGSLWRAMPGTRIHRLLDWLLPGKEIN